MLGVIVNTAAVIVGSLIGLLFKKGIPEKISRAVIGVIGLCVIYIGVDSALAGSNTIVLIVSMVLGTIAGTMIDIDDKISRLGGFIEHKFKKNEGGVSLTEGFMTGSLLFCVGAMTIVGSMNAGLMGDNKILYTKSLLDLISACMLSTTLGLGVMFSAAFVFVFQGALVLLSGLLQSVLTDALLIAEITCAGGVMIFALGLNMIGLTKFKVANFMPAIIFVPIIYYLAGFLPI